MLYYLNKKPHSNLRKTKIPQWTIWGGGLSHKTRKNCSNRKFVVVSFDTQVAFHKMWPIVTVRKIENFTHFVYWFTIKILKNKYPKTQLIQKQFLCHRLNQWKMDKNMLQALWQLVALMAVKRQNRQVTVLY